MSQRIELRAVIASKQGLSCLGYYTLANRTKHLRERLYVCVRDGDKLFLPQGPEHFPVREIEAYYLGRMRFGVAESIGEGGGEVLFSCEGSSAQAADEGATVITATLAGLDGVLNQNALSRHLAAVPEKFSYVVAVHRSQVRPYRPPTLPARSSAPAPFTGEERESRGLLTFEDRKREKLKEWGVLEAYDDRQAEREVRQAIPTPDRGFQQSYNNASWKEAPWK